MKKKETLREFFDRNNIERGNDEGFSLFIGLFGSNRMDVSRRYLECAPWSYLLNYVVENAWFSEVTGMPCIMVEAPEVEAVTNG